MIENANIFFMFPLKKFSATRAKIFGYVTIMEGLFCSRMTNWGSRGNCRVCLLTPCGTGGRIFKYMAEHHDTWWHGNDFCITGPIWGESAGDRWIPMESQKHINPVIMDIHNSIMDIHNSIIVIQLMDIDNCKPITNKAAIMDIHN